MQTHLLLHDIPSKDYVRMPWRGTSEIGILNLQIMDGREILVSDIP